VLEIFVGRENEMQGPHQSANKQDEEVTVGIFLRCVGREGPLSSFRFASPKEVARRRNI